MSGDAAAEAFTLVAEVRDDPARRLGLAGRFYADLFLSLHNILPVRYPLDGFSISEILALENYAGRLIDYGVMLPRIQALYAFAAADLDEPRLLGFVHDGLPAYAWTNDEDHPWTTSRSPRLRSVLRWLTSS